MERTVVPENIQEHAAAFEKAKKENWIYVRAERMLRETEKVERRVVVRIVALFACSVFVIVGGYIEQMLFISVMGTFSFFVFVMDVYLSVFDRVPEWAIEDSKEFGGAEAIQERARILSSDKYVLAWMLKRRAEDFDHALSEMQGTEHEEWGVWAQERMAPIRQEIEEEFQVFEDFYVPNVENELVSEAIHRLRRYALLSPSEFEELSKATGGRL